MNNYRYHCLKRTSDTERNMQLGLSNSPSEFLFHVVKISRSYHYGEKSPICRDIQKKKEQNEVQRGADLAEEGFD